MTIADIQNGDVVRVIPSGGGAFQFFRITKVSRTTVTMIDTTGTRLRVYPSVLHSKVGPGERSPWSEQK